MQYCAVCLIAKNENYYIKEWAEYHLRIGFDTLIIYDNESVIPIKETLSELIALGRVIIHDIQNDLYKWGRTQGKAYTDCITRYKNAFKWIAVIDSDEFIFPKKVNNIKEFLAEYECYGAVVANWVCFGTSGRNERDGNSQIFSFIHAESVENTTIKSIVQPKKVAEFTGPHGPALLPDSFSVSSDHFPLEPDVYSAPFVSDDIQINHYALRTWHDYETKAARYIKNKIPFTKMSVAEEQKKYCRKNMDIIKFYAPLRNIAISRHRPVAVPETVKDMVETSMDMLANNDFLVTAHRGLDKI
jgi:hypothetical protein